MMLHSRYYEGLAVDVIRAKVTELAETLAALDHHRQERLSVQDLNPDNLLAKPKVMVDAETRSSYVVLLTLQPTAHETCCGVFYHSQISNDVDKLDYIAHVFTLSPTGRITEQRVTAMPPDITDEMERQLYEINQQSGQSGFVYATIAALREE